MKIGIRVSIHNDKIYEGEKENIRKFVERLREEGFEVRFFNHSPFTR